MNVRRNSETSLAVLIVAVEKKKLKPNAIFAEGSSKIQSAQSSRCAPVAIIKPLMENTKNAVTAWLRSRSPYVKDVKQKKPKVRVFTALNASIK